MIFLEMKLPSATKTALQFSYPKAGIEHKFCFDHFKPNIHSLFLTNKWFSPFYNHQNSRLIDWLIWSRVLLTRIKTDGKLELCSWQLKRFNWPFVVSFGNKRRHWFALESSLYTWRQVWGDASATPHVVQVSIQPGHLSNGPKEWHKVLLQIHQHDYTSPQSTRFPFQCCAHQHHRLSAGTRVCRLGCSHRRRRQPLLDLKDGKKWYWLIKTNLSKIIRW